MKVTTVTILSLLSLAAAQSIADLPTCATTCALNGIGATGCTVTDSACICSNESFLSNVESCIRAPGACNEADIQATLAFANSFCGGIPSPNGTNSTTTPSGSATTDGPTVTDTPTPLPGTASDESETASATEASETDTASATESGSASGTSASVASVTSGGIAAPTLMAVGVAQVLGVVGVVVAAL